MNSVAASAAQPSSSVDNLTSPPPTRNSRPPERDSHSALPKSVVEAPPRFGAAASSLLFQQAAVLAAAATQRKQMQILSRHMALAAKGASSVSTPPPLPPLAESYYDYRDDEASLPPALGSKDPDPQLLNAFFTSALQAASTLKQCSQGGQGGISPLQAIANMPYPPNGSAGGVGINANGSPYSRPSQRSPYAGGQAHPFAPDRGSEFHQRLNFHHYHPHHYTSPNCAPLSHSDLGVARQNGSVTGKNAKNGPSKLVPPAGPNSLIRPIAKPHPHHHSAAASLAASTNGAPLLPKAPVNIAPKPGPPNSRASAPDPGRSAGKVVKSSPPVTITSTLISSSPPKSNPPKYSPVKLFMPPLTNPLPHSSPAVVSVSPSLYGIEKIIEPGVPTTPKATTLSSSTTPAAVITNASSKCTEPNLKTPARKRSLEGGSLPPTPKQVCKKKPIDSIPAFSAPLPVKTMAAAAAFVAPVDNIAPMTGVEASIKSPSIPGELKSSDRGKPNCQGSASQVKAKAKKKPAATKQFPGLVTSPPPVSKSCNSSESVITASQISTPSTLPSTPRIATVISHNPSHADNNNKNNNNVVVITTVSPKTHSLPSETSTTSSSTLAPKATMPLLTPKRNKQADMSVIPSSNGATRELPTLKQAGSHHKAVSAQTSKQTKSIAAVSLSCATAGSLTGGGSIGRYKTVTPALTGSTPSTAQQQTMATPQQFLFYSPATNQFYSGLANTPLNNNNPNTNHHQVPAFNNFYGAGLQAMLPHAASNPNVIGYATAGPPSGLGSVSVAGGNPNNGTGAVSYLIINANPHHNQTPALASNPFFHQALGIGGGSGLNNGCLSFQTTPQQANLAAQSMPAAQYKSPGIGSLLNLASLQVGPGQGSGSSYQNPAPQMGQHQIFYQANPAPSQPTFISTCTFPQTTPSVVSMNNINSGIHSCSSDSTPSHPKLVKCRDSDKADNHLPNKVGRAGGSLVTERASYKSVDDDTYNNNASHFEPPHLPEESCGNDTEAPALSDPEQQPHDVLFHLLDGHVIRESSQPLPLPTEPFRLRFMAKHGFRTASPCSNTDSGLGEARSGRRSQNCTSVITQGPAFKKAKSNEHLASQEPGETKNMLNELSTEVADVSLKSEDGMLQSLVEHRKVAVSSLSTTSHVSVIQMAPQASVLTQFHSLAAQGLCDAPQLSSRVSDLESPKEAAGCSLSQTSPTPSHHDIKESSPQSSGLTSPSSSEPPLMQPPPRDIQRWTVNDVHSFISNLSGCREYAETFKANEIDGPALLLLKEDHLTSALKIKLGPALKIHARVSEIRFNQSI